MMLLELSNITLYRYTRVERDNMVGIEISCKASAPATSYTIDSDGTTSVINFPGREPGVNYEIIIKIPAAL